MILKDAYWQVSSFVLFSAEINGIIKLELSKIDLINDLYIFISVFSDRRQDLLAKCFNMFRRLYTLVLMESIFLLKVKYLSNIIPKNLFSEFCSSCFNFSLYKYRLKHSLSAVFLFWVNPVWTFVWSHFQSLFRRPLSYFW